MINQILHSHELLLIFAVLPCFIALIENKKKQFWLFCLSYGFAFSIGYFIKQIAAVDRPFINNPELLKITTNIPETYSFPSLHTTLITVFAWSLSKAKPKLTLAGFTTAFIISLSRVYLGVHYFADISAGFLLGTIVFWTIYSFMNTDKVFSKEANPNVRRKIFHLIYGVGLALVIHFELISHQNFILIIWSLSLYVVYSHFQRKNKLNKLISYFERNPNPKYYGLGPLFYLVSSFGAVLFFPKGIAAAAVINLAIGDSVNALIGQFTFQPISADKPNHGKKKIYPAVAAAISTIILSLTFVNLLQAASGAIITFVLEFSAPKIKGKEIDDNLLIPIFSGLAMSLS